MKFIHRFLCVVIGLAALVATSAFFHAILPPAIPVGIAAKLKFFTEHKDEFDTLFLGASHFYYAVSPEIFDDKTRTNGLPTRTFNFGIDGMHPPENLYVLEQILRTKPRNLKWVFLELSGVQTKWTENVRTHRLVYWHDWPRTALTLKKFHRSGEPWLVKVARLGLGRNSIATNLVLFGRQFCNVGRASDYFFSRNSQSAAAVASELGPKGDGYRLSGNGMPAEEAERFRKALAKAVGDSRPRLLDPVTDFAYRDAAEKVQQAGASMVLVVTPVLSQTPLRFQAPPPPEPLLLFNNSKKYPQLYTDAARYDDGHLSREASEEFTRLLAQELIRLARKP